MGTSLSGLTPATTFDGLLKTSDNEPLDGTLKAISTGDGTDTMLELSTSALQIGGATGMYWDNTNKRLGINNTSPAAPLEVNGEIRSTSLIRLMIGGSNKVLMQNANTVINSDVAIGQAAAPSARLHIKGSGATSATTSLLVQNSSGSELFKVQDDGLIQAQNLKIDASSTLPLLYAENNTNKSLQLGNQAHLSAFSRIDFKTFDGSAYSEVMRITGNTAEPKVGIGETTPTARLHVKGSGNDNTTTSLLVQNSDASTSLTYDDSGELFLTGSKTQITLQRDGGNGGVIGNNNGRTYFGNSSALVYLGGKIGINQQTPTAQLQVKGSGATSATTALLVQNSAGTDLFKVRDDGASYFYGQLNTTGAITNGTLLMNSSRFQIGSTANGALNFSNNGLAYQDDNVPTQDASAAFQVNSTARGFLPPRMTTTERDAIASPAAGLMIYNTDTNTAECWNGSAWMPMF